MKQKKVTKHYEHILARVVKWTATKHVFLVDETLEQVLFGVKETREKKVLLSIVPFSIFQLGKSKKNIY